MRLIHLRTRKCELCISKVIVNSIGDRYDCDQHRDHVANCSRDTAVVVQVSYFECNFGKNGTTLTNLAAFFSSDSKLTKRWKGNKYQFIGHAGTHPE